MRQLDLATSGKGGIGSFLGVCVISAAFGLADAHVQGGMIGDLSLMRPEFVQVAMVSFVCLRFTFIYMLLSDFC